LFILAMEWL